MNYKYEYGKVVIVSLVPKADCPCSTFTSDIWHNWRLWSCALLIFYAFYIGDWLIICQPETWTTKCIQFIQKEFQLMSIHALCWQTFSSFQASKQVAVYTVCSISQGQTSSKRSQWESVCLLSMRWNWTDKAVRNTGETFGNTYSKLLNESGWKYTIPLVFPNPSYFQ